MRILPLAYMELPWKAHFRRIVALGIAKSVKLYSEERQCANRGHVLRMP